jgi:hypothetical protein
VHQPACDCRSAYSDDEEPEHEGEPEIWLEPADDPKQYGSDAPDGEYVNVNESLHSDVGGLCLPAQAAPLRSNDRHARIEKDEEENETAHERSERDSHNCLPGCFTPVLKVLD